MPQFIPDTTWNRLLDNLSGAFLTAATNTHTDLRDRLAEALADADLLPEVCRADFAHQMQKTAAMS